MEFMNPNPYPDSKMKRRSLPCQSQMGSLNLYSGQNPPLTQFQANPHRRFSERSGSCMIYRYQTKPDIDLISDFIYPNKKSISNAFGIGNDIGKPSIGTHLPSSYFPPESTLYLPTIPGSSQKQQMNVKPKCSNNGSAPGVEGLESTKFSNAVSNSMSSFSESKSTSSSNRGCRKVRLKLHKYPGGGGIGKENKFIEMQTIESSTSGGAFPINSSSTTSTSTTTLRDEQQTSFTSHPGVSDSNSSRRYSDISSYTYGKTISKIEQRKSLGRNHSTVGIICSTGDLKELKCLTSSAQEIQNRSSSCASIHESLGNRSKSFDATFNRTTPRKGIGSSWFSRRHLPISVKLPIPLNSPSLPSSPGPIQLVTQQQQQQPMPILTVTNESSGHCEIIEVPSPPGSGIPFKPNQSAEPDNKTKVTWDKNGSIVDASILGSLIENHLIRNRMSDMKRRATVAVSNISSTIGNEPGNIPFKTSGRARSASASTLGVPGIGSSIILENNSGQKLNRKKNGPSTRRISFQIGESRESHFGTPIIDNNKPEPELKSSSSGESSLPELKQSTETFPRESPFVETIMMNNPDGNVNSTTTVFHPTSFMYEPTYHGRICTEDEMLDESRRRAEYYKNIKIRDRSGSNSEEPDNTNGPRFLSVLLSRIIPSLIKL